MNRQVCKQDRKITRHRDEEGTRGCSGTWMMDELLTPGGSGVVMGVTAAEAGVVGTMLAVSVTKGLRLFMPTWGQEMRPWAA